MQRLTLPNCLMLVWALCGGAAQAQASAADEVIRLQQAGQTTAALARAEQLLTNQPSSPQLRFLKGVLLLDQRRDAQALDVFEQLTIDYPQLAEPYNNLALLHARAGRYELARAALQQALRARPDYAVALENLGDIYVALAKQSYAQSLRLAPTDVDYARKLEGLNTMLPAATTPAAIRSENLKEK